MEIVIEKLGFDELHLGFSMYYGAHEDGEPFHAVSFGFLLFQITPYRPLK